MEIRGKILVVDDDPGITKLLQSKLTAYGYETATASDGEQGLQKYEFFEPDIIILDILMPKMDGYTFVQEFKKIGDLRTSPIIILTSKESMQDIFAVEGINDYIVKPFDMDYLIRKIDKRMVSKTKRILLVDDADETVSILESSLTTRGYDVITASDGLDGLAIAKREQPDLMLLDVMLPKLDGYNVCRMLKCDKKYKKIPVILLTARCQGDEKFLANEVGADGCFIKPYDGTALLEAAKELLWD